MKKLFICLLALSSAVFVGCKKDNNSSPDSAPASFTCKINGVQWTSVLSGGGIQSGLINITGKAADSTTVTMTLLDDVIGTYNLGLTNNSGAVGYNISSTSISSWTSNAVDSSISICHLTTIDTVNKTMSGTFSALTYNFVAGTSKIITDGVFTNIPYTTGGYVGNNSFAVKINGTAMAPTTISGVLTTSPLALLTLTASDNGPANTVGIVLPTNAAVGTHAVGTILDPYYCTYNAGTTYMISNSGSGNIVITSHNTSTKHIAGTFNFTAADFGGGSATATLTAGSFDITYN